AGLAEARRGGEHPGRADHDRAAPGGAGHRGPARPVRHPEEGAGERTRRPDPALRHARGRTRGGAVTADAIVPAEAAESTADAIPTRRGAPLRATRQFRLFWAGQTISQIGDRISELALPLIAVTMLGVTAGQAGVLTAVIWLPNVAAAVVGAWVDRRANRRRL